MVGKFITLEGSEGVGKSTNLAFLSAAIESSGVSLVVTREPGGTTIAEELREVLLKNRDEKFDAHAELLTVFAARAQHLNTVIRPALARGDWVLCDRFTDATYAYQGYARGLPLEIIAELEASVQQGVHPDITFLLDIEVEKGLARARQRASLDRFESEAVAFFERVREGYLTRAKAHSERFRIIDASQPLEAVQRDLHKQLDLLLSEKDC